MIRKNKNMKKTTSLLLLTFLISFISYGQSNTGVKMKSFVPKNKAFDIYYPENFSVSEDEENIVSITNEKNEINITISAYAFEKEIDASSITGVMDNYFTKDFSVHLKDSDFKQYKSKFDNLIECKFKEKENYWMWWAVSKKNKLIMISLNKDKDITDENLNLLRFMINNLLIN